MEQNSIYSPDWITAIVTSIYTIITFTTLILIWRQLLLLNKNTISSSYHYIYDKMIDIDKFFIEHPDLKLYFYSNKSHLSIKNKIEKEKILSIAEMMVDFFDCVYYQKDVMRKETFDAKAAYIGDIYNKSPIIREYLSRPHLDKWYSKGFLDFIKTTAKYMEEI